VANGPVADALIPRSKPSGTLVLVNLAGGNDGLNTVVPYANGHYYDMRPDIAIAESDVLHLDQEVGLHPALTFVRDEYNAGRVSIVQGVGMPDPDFSHFVQMARWMRGWGGSDVPNTGWLGRWLDAQSGNNLARGIHVGQGVPLHLVGAVRRGVSVPTRVGFGSVSTPAKDRLYAGIRTMAANNDHPSPLSGLLTGTLRDQLDVSALVKPIYATPNIGEQLTQDFVAAARLINANLGTRVLSLTLGAFDHHADQRSTNIYARPHDVLMAQLNAGLQAFWSTLAPSRAGNVTVMTMSEFGRRLLGNASKGSDHGAASCLFVMGPGVRPGRVGQYPSLTNTLENDQLAAGIDFRQVYSTVVANWLGGDTRAVLGRNYGTLPIFRRRWYMDEALADPAPVDRGNPIEPAGELVTVDSLG
jgi:uncharacterized protein (DUF1501 family)